MNLHDDSLAEKAVWRDNHGGKGKRLIQHNFKTTETEAEIIKKKMKSLGITNTSAFLRSMVLNGYILKLDLPQIRE